MKYMWKAVVAAVLLCCVFEIGCGDTFRQIATPISPPSGDPSNGGSLAIIQNSGTTLPGMTQQINVSGDTNVGEKPIGQGATMGALDPSNSLIFTPNTLSNNVTAVAVNSFAEVTIGLPKATGASAGPTWINGARVGIMYVTVAGATEACPTGSGYLGAVNSSVLSLTKSICLDDGTNKMLNPNFVVQSSDGVNVYVLDSSTNQMAIVDAASGTVSKIVSVGSSPVYAAISADQKYVYVLNKNSDNISIFQVADQTVLPTTIALPAGAGAQFMVTDQRLNRLYVANTGAGSISVFDISQPATPVPVGGAVAVGPTPIRLTVLKDGSRVYVANAAAGITNQVTELLASNLSTVKTFTVNTAANATVTGITSSIDSTKVYVGTKDPTNTTNGVTIIRTSDDTVVLTVSSTKLDPTCPSTTVPAPCQLYTPVYLFTNQ